MNSILRTISKFDDIFLGRRIKFIRTKFYNRRQILPLKNMSPYRFTTYYSRDSQSFLASLCDKYGSDKGALNQGSQPYTWPSHSYTDYYSRIFSDRRLDVRKVFECGIGTNFPEVPSSMGLTGKPGASLRVWKDYFPNAEIFGADIDRRILFQEERIRTFHIDQLNVQSIFDFWQSVGKQDFDFILDDGLHTFDAGITLFENSISALAENGVYIIEDVWPINLVKFQDYFLNTNYDVEYVTLDRPNLTLSDNCLVVVRKSKKSQTG